MAEVTQDICTSCGGIIVQALCPHCYDGIVTDKGGDPREDPRRDPDCYACEHCNGTGRVAWCSRCVPAEMIGK